MADDGQYCARDGALPDGIFDDGVGFEQTPRVHAYGLGAYVFQLLCLADGRHGCEDEQHQESLYGLHRYVMV